MQLKAFETILEMERGEFEQHLAAKTPGMEARIIDDRRGVPSVTIHFSCDRRLERFVIYGSGRKERAERYVVQYNEWKTSGPKRPKSSVTHGAEIRP